MPGLFAHLALADGAGVAEVGWFYFGAVASDYPYIVSDDPAQCAWADLCHTRKLGERFGVGLDALRRDPKNKNLRAWLLGYAVHPVADAVIHPVVNLAVGSYEENREAHRLCERSQDIFLFGRYLDETSLLRLLAALALCAPRKKLDDSIVRAWSAMLAECYPDSFRERPPQFQKWHDSFLARLHLFLSRSQSSVAERIDFLGGVAEKTRGDGRKYIETLPTPGGGTITYGALFEKALTEVKTMTERVATIIDEGRYDDNPFGAWDIDAGGYEEEPVDPGSGNARKLLYWES